jgi:AbrB family looped-hinge helix DNA binding protein
MRTTIDAAGRIVVPKALRDQLGFTAGAELDVEAVDGRLEVRVPSRVRIEEGPYGPRLVADGGEPSLTVEQVRELVDRERR